MLLPSHIVDRIRSVLATMSTDGFHVDHEAARYGGIALIVVTARGCYGIVVLGLLGLAAPGYAATVKPWPFPTTSTWKSSLKSHSRCCR
jgi:hypothetical protein